MAVLRALGADLESAAVEEDRRGPHTETRRERALAAAVEARERELGGRLLEPVLLAWDGRPPSLAIRLPDLSRGRLGQGREARLARLTLRLEDGDSTVVDLDLAQFAAGRRRNGADPEASGTQNYLIPPSTWAARLCAARGGDRAHPGAGGECPAPAGKALPLGYHRLTVEVAGRVGDALVIAAPRRCFSSPGLGRGASPGAPPAWGIFAPVYALRSERDWGAGDLDELDNLARQVHKAGGSFVATLPLLAGYLDDPFEPAPYRPVSRLFWNEFFLAPERIQGFGSCERAQGLWASSSFQKRLAALRAGRLVDYKETMALKRAVLEELAAGFFARGEDRRNQAFRSYLGAHPEAEHYAAFREGVESCGTDWRDWTDQGSALRAERLGKGDAPTSPLQSPVGRYHLYCQWQAEAQLAAVAASPSSCGLFPDLPVGVHPGGYDTWRWHRLFVHGVSTGAPPDSFFALGQDWDFPPPQPERAREAGHQYFAACLRHHMRHADVLRVDHIMGLHRLWVIPTGLPASDGVYLRYPAEELYAVLALESERSRTVVVGEDLGTVPLGVRSTMRRRGVLRTWVFQMSLRPRAAVPVGDIPSHSLSSLNTHDMCPLAGFLSGGDIAARVETGQLAAADAPRQADARDKLRVRLTHFLAVPERSGLGGGPTEGRVHDPAQRAEVALLRSALLHMMRSATSLVLVNLEDLLFETQPQNLPGTGAERPNWRRKLRAGETEVREAIETVARWLRPPERL